MAFKLDEMIFFFLFYFIIKFTETVTEILIL